MNYKPEDFSPIFGPEDKPVNPGWYAGSYFSRKVAGRDPLVFYKWNGRMWIGGEARYWFGLKEATK